VHHSTEIVSPPAGAHDDTRPNLWRRHPVLVFWVLACSLAWAAFITIELFDRHPSWPYRFDVVNVANQLSKHAPGLAAVIVAGLVAGVAGTRRLIGSILIWQVPWKWYAVVLAGPIGLYLLTLGIWSLARGQAWSPVDTTALAGLAGLFVSAFLGAGLGEELGWRGWALPLLLRDRSPLSASLWLGFGWGVWHAHAYLLPIGDCYHDSFPLKIVFLMAASVGFTWIYQRTSGSTLVAALLHASNNAINDWSDRLCAIPKSDHLPMYILTVLMTILALTLVISGRVTWKPPKLP